jgi:carbon-monoxide dehydrogenase small subunit
MIDLKFNLNGDDVSLHVAPERRLLDILREDMQLTGAKPGCGIGRCGACMVWLDNTPMNSCLLMAFQLQDRSVTTIEAVAQDPASAPVREAMANCGGVQCGYCSAGMVMTLTHLHTRMPRPDVREAAALTCGNLCRCTGYGGINRALDELFSAA